MPYPIGMVWSPPHYDVITKGCGGATPSEWYGHPSRYDVIIKGCGGAIPSEWCDHPPHYDVIIKGCSGETPWNGMVTLRVMM